MSRSVRPTDSTRKRCALTSDSKLPIGSRFCKCSSCGAYFKCDRAFQLHRVGRFNADRSCAPTARMAELGLTLTGAFWHLPPRAFPAERRRALALRAVGAADQATA
jgi:hypothetical protein